MNERYNQLSRIVIQGFKSIKECDLELKNANVLIGANGAGKSNFISVFELLKKLKNQKLSWYAQNNGANTLFLTG
jgi:predicted ATPase